MFKQTVPPEQYQNYVKCRYILYIFSLLYYLSATWNVKTHTHTKSTYPYIILHEHSHSIA